MSKKSKYIVFTLVILSIILTSTYIGYHSFTKPDSSRNPADMVTNKIYPIMATTIDENIDIDERTTSNTTIQYNYKVNDILLENYTKKAGLELQNLSREELQQILSDVQILEFSRDLVICEKNVIKNNNCYIVGTDGEKINIFFKDENDIVTLIEETNISIDNLPEKDKTMLENGIYATDEAMLSKIIQDYTS